MAEFIESEDQNQVEEQQEEKQETVESKIPEKFRNKSIEEIVSSYQELERFSGKQAQEIGEVRKLADELIKRDFQKQAPKEEPEEEFDFFVDPKKAVERVVANHPKLKQAEEKVAHYERMENLRRLQQAHPDMQQVVGEGDFMEWVKKSKIRTSLFVKADQEFDFDAADELLSTYKELRGKKSVTQSQEAQEIQNEADRTLKKASVSAGSSQEVSKKIFRRADLIKLRLQDPERYELLENEIMQAYAEGRVR